MSKPKTRTNTNLRYAPQAGSVIVIVMVFIFIFMAMGVSLYILVRSESRSTETERTDLKAFNVAEAGVDAGMLALKLDWPNSSTETVDVDEALLKTALQTANPGLYDPTRSPVTDFIQVSVYDNTTDVADPTAPDWDANGDGKMFVDATSNVDDDRHRIIILAERQDWPLYFGGHALVVDTVDSNGQGLSVEIEDGDGSPVYSDVQDAEHKGVTLGDGVTVAPNPTTFDDIVTDAMKNALYTIAQSQHTYFEGAGAATAASTYLATSASAGKVVWVKSTTGGVTVGGNNQVGTIDQPTIVVIDTPAGSTNDWDMKGNAEFYGIVIVLNNATLRGTCSIHGAVYCGGTLSNKGNGSSGELYWNKTVIYNLNHQYVISVNQVPNTWEEYTLPKES
jgi:Tfp pilus assembly protein PilX